MWKKLKRKLIYIILDSLSSQTFTAAEVKGSLTFLLKAKSFIIIEQFTNVEADYILHGYWEF